MLGEIVVIGENRTVHACLHQAFRDDTYSLLWLRDVPEAVPYLREPSCKALVALFCNVTMRREQDFNLLSEISTTHPHLQILLLPENARSLPSDLPVRNGNVHMLQKSASVDGLIQTVQHAARTAGILTEKARLEDRTTHSEGLLGGSSPLFSTAFLTRVGMADVPVLLQGETGAGKEVVARRLCAYSPRAHKPFLKLNCAALPSELVESELFGYEKGAFTGAIVDKPGKFEIAQGGTILLDEIGDMDIRLQAKLLQVLQDGEIQPLGSSRTVRVDVRVLAATHCNLRRAIEQGNFREDLYYRLNVINIVIPPLRERKNEILSLANVLLRRHVRPGEEMPHITEELKRTMLEYHWPGNVRELENIMRRFIVYQHPSMLVDELNQAIGCSKPKPVAIANHHHGISVQNGSSNGSSSIDRLAEQSRIAESKLLLEALEATRWNRRQAAASLNLEYRAFLYKLQKYGIADKRDRAEDKYVS
ncbi:sigma-54-dependent Fis family transcriptional regulator [Alloacidobacterium dinghuense]|uniref:Sigma-54-dependent Fis family transcriptional regulator n=1 Tax=Alloacidobacterium dinghuense TaxID=2763107 RepID=A0A7G8BCC1_9BACT|nr:sigma-54 dependent transcriptional regulator [Alloacidobacterium dinghuense]QNI30191.1 sigma-54-dependent Fis family transcriptional regulator [Alloacidobacterium dinghuense]